MDLCVIAQAQNIFWKIHMTRGYVASILRSAKAFKANLIRILLLDL